MVEKFNKNVTFIDFKNIKFFYLNNLIFVFNIYLINFF